ncbi:hypothetical protein KR093_001348 [Drosophila rubida]|uniref:Uncharacterized protein n=1 Tax=Drosophila rubida TaxID=30044 RepID=A0AAD4JSI3_9MUSC|nr:hypothetical protein KR093_001348 [Drosophila rubida]
MKVLAIGDPEDVTDKPEPSKYAYQRDFAANFKKHLGFLLVGTRSPIEVNEELKTMGRFQARNVKEDNKRRRYLFHFARDGEGRSGTIISGAVMNGGAVMEDVRNRLSEENWVSENVFETPFKTERGKEYNDNDSFIQSVVLDAIDADEKRVFKYVLNLHRAYMKEKKTITKVQ